MTQEEFILQDRISAIREVNKKYDLEHNSYLSFSGGKDSVILHNLIDLALPNNQIPRVYLNTGMEYKVMVDYVKELASKDKRIIIKNNTKSIKKTLEEFGYPFKSKEFAVKVNLFQRKGLTHGL